MKSSDLILQFPAVIIALIRMCLQEYGRPPLQRVGKTKIDVKYCR